MSEMRGILARDLWHFDISLEEESEQWNRQKVYLLWDKPDLMVRLKAVEEPQISSRRVGLWALFTSSHL